MTTDTEYIEMIEEDMAATTQGPWLLDRVDTEDLDPDEMRWWIQARLPDRTIIDIAVVMEQADAEFFEKSKDRIRELIWIVRRLREENDEWHRISERWGRASGKQYGKLAAIRDLANARLADTAHMASIQEAECLWAIVAATEGDA